MYFCLFLSSFVALYSGQTLCVYMGCTDIDYCIYDICGFMDGFGFLLWLCAWICVWMCLGMCLGYVYGYRVSILREAWFNKYRGLPLLGARFHHHWDLLSRGPFHHYRVLLLHEAHFYHHWDLLLHEARFIIIGTYSFTRPISIIIGTYSLLEAHFYHHWDLLASRGPFHHYRVLLLHEAHFYHHWDLLASRGPFHHYRVLLLHEAHLNDSPNFSNFSRQKWKNLPQYAMSNKFF
jgi:hypothetical protein